MPESRRTGRWRTGQQSKQRIVEVAREHFKHGYEQATVRAIAADACVDVAMDPASRKPPMLVTIPREISAHFLTRGR